jgi:hexosaminidase
LENNYNGTTETRSVLQIRNTGTEPFPSSGWTIFFNGPEIRGAGSDNAVVSAQLINGDFLRILPRSSFQALAPGKSVQTDFLSRGLKNITDYPKGFYIVFDDRPTKAFLPKLITISLLDDPKREEELAGRTFRQNALVTDLPLSALSPVFPTPASYKKSNGYFEWKASLSLHADEAFRSEAEYLKAEMLRLAGAKVTSSKDRSGVSILINKKAMPSAEAYELIVGSKQITINASSPAGVFYGIQSLSMLLPSGPAVSAGQVKTIAAIEMKDQPRFGHRAFMMDIARNFQPPSQIMKVIDLMALYKLNVLHLHMSEDEGWRLEIPGLPELTEVGSRRAHPFQPHQAIQPAYGSGPDTSNRFGSGHLSRADYISILKYATARHIRVIPEVETPGHARAAIKAMDARYERLLKLGDKAGAEKYLLRDVNDKSVYRSVQGFNDNVINPSLPSVYTFLEKVTDEIIAMHREAGAPLETIHFGGDEVPGGVWEQSPAVKALMQRDKSLASVDELWYYFFSRINSMLGAKGLYFYGWEETGMHKAMVAGQKKMVVDPRFAGKNFRADVWNNLSGNEDLAYKLANAGYKVVLTNVTNMYMDLAYSESYYEPGQYWGGYVDVEKLFRFIPFNYYKNQAENERNEPLSKSHFDKMERLRPENKANIVGLQAPLWSEIITSAERMEYLLLPKVLGLAERSWAPDPDWANEQDMNKAASMYRKAWSAFVNVLGKRELPRLDHHAGGFQYRIPPPAYVKDNGKLKANVLYPGLTIRYSTDGTEPTMQSKIFTGEMDDVQGIALRVFNQAGRGGRTVRP